LTTAISDYETSINEANRTKGAKVSAREGQDEEINDAMSLLRQLDVVIRNKFSGNRAMLTDMQ
jgi:molybdate-binding protein